MDRKQRSTSRKVSLIASKATPTIHPSLLPPILSRQTATGRVYVVSAGATTWWGRSNGLRQVTAHARESWCKRIVRGPVALAHAGDRVRILLRVSLTSA